MAKKKPATKRTATPVESIRHKDKRANITTEELRDFLADEELAPQTMLYPRDPSLDPQLVWKGKDEQDRQDLAVPVVPIYIQEEIHPQAIIDDVVNSATWMASADSPSTPHHTQPSLFADFNGGPHDFAQKVEFYRHEQNWSNRLILGDSLLVMTSLAEKEGLKGKVQTIYFDPLTFTGADEPYDKLKRALRAEIDEGAWSSLYSTVSRPFPRPDSGQIAVKVINHYGDEVLKVFAV